MQPTEVATFTPLFIPGSPRRRRLRQYSGQTGIYLIREGLNIVYIGLSSHCVVKALYRHFYPWQPDRQGRHRRVTYYDRLEAHHYTATIITTTPEQANALEEALIKTLKPRDNHIHIHAESTYSNLNAHTTPTPEPSTAPHTPDSDPF